MFLLYYYIHMISTKSIITSLNDVPREWVFEYYLKLPDKLTGQDIKIKSIFSEDKVPSMVIFYSKDKYLFKDFSSDKSGDGAELVKDMFNFSTKGEAAHRIIEDYNLWLLNNGEDVEVRDFKVQQRFKVTEFETRSWNTDDSKYWGKYHIGSKLLDKYNVKPLSFYKMEKTVADEKVERVINGYRIYGYFKADGTLYKIYQPMITTFKFMKIHSYIQGSEQLTLRGEYLVICSSMKDMLAFIKLGFKNIEVIAPDSENTLIPEHVISAYRLKYKNICTLFDIDQAGLNAMAKYQDKYNMPSVVFNMEKDLSDSVEKYGLTKVREEITPRLKQVLL